MHPALRDSPQEVTPELPVDRDIPPAGLRTDEHGATRNFSVITLYQILMRTGWIFKTESIIMPAVLDTIGGAAWLRGCLPLLNRLGQSIPPLLFSRRLKIMPRKKWGVILCTLGMSASFFGLAAMWLIKSPAFLPWLPAIFLFFYATFFAMSGMNQLSLSTLQGKLVRPNWRGRLMTCSNILGATVAISAAWLLLPRWLSASDGQFHLIFGFSCLCFALSAASMLLISEPVDNYHQPAINLQAHFSSAWQLLQKDQNFRRLTLVAALFGCSMMLFPHYQALGRLRLQMQFDHLVILVIVQNVGTALFSILAGPVADRSGNRLVLRTLMFGITCLPLLAIGLAQWGPRAEALYSYLVFFLVGMTPVIIKTLQNYTLECSQAVDHPKYLSTLGLCMAAPILCSPLVGLLVDITNFETVFLGIALLLLVGWLFTFTLKEPRHHQKSFT